MHQSFTTRNTHVPGREVHLKLVDGPVLQPRRRLEVHAAWARRASVPASVELELHYGFNNFALQALVGPVFDKIASHAWSKPSSSAPSRSTARLMIEVTVACSPAPREVFEQALALRRRRHGARCGAGQRPGRSAFRNWIGQALTPGIWGRAVRMGCGGCATATAWSCAGRSRSIPKVARRERFQQAGRAGNRLVREAPSARPGQELGY